MYCVQITHATYLVEFVSIVVTGNSRCICDVLDIMLRMIVCRTHHQLTKRQWLSRICGRGGICGRGRTGGTGRIYLLSQNMECL